MAKAPRSPITTDREKTIGVRVSPEEYAMIREQAEKLGLRAASYVRMLALQAVLKDSHEELVSAGYLGESRQTDKKVTYQFTSPENGVDPPKKTS